MAEGRLGEGLRKPEPVDYIGLIFTRYKFTPYTLSLRGR